MAGGWPGGAGCRAPGPGDASAGRHEGQPLYEWIVRKAKEEGLAGATVLRGLLGFGAHSRIHTSKILRLSTDLPIVVEIVDTEESIESFLPLIDEVIKEGLATVERVEVQSP